jgi:hypothetical protein
MELFNDIIQHEGYPEWLFIGRLVPLMRKGGGHANRLFSAIDNIKKHIKDQNGSEKVDGCDSARWRITASNMVLLPKGGERGVGNLTKWRGTHHRISDGLEKDIVIRILQEIVKTPLNEVTEFKESKYKTLDSLLD